MSEGRAWARRVLVELHDRRYRPRAWLSLLAESFVRARMIRGERPGEHRLVVALGAAGAGAWVIPAFLGHPVLAAAGATWWLLAVAMVDWHLGMLERPDGTRVTGLGAANVLSLVRAGLAPVLAGLFGTAVGATALGLAGASDALDGWLARRRGEVTRLGIWLDGSVDGLVLGAAAIGAHLSGRAEAWLAALILARVALPWLVVTIVTFARAETPGQDGVVSGRLPGLMLFAGLSLLAFDLPGGSVVAALGAAGGLATFTASVARAGSRGRMSKIPASGL